MKFNRLLLLAFALMFMQILSAQFSYVGTYAGTNSSGYINGTLSNARFNFPYGVTFDGDSLLYVAEVFNHTIRKININNGIVSTLAGTGAAGFSNGIGTSASFNSPTHTYLKNGYLYVADNLNNAVRRINLSNDSVETVAGNGTQGFQNGVASNSTFFQVTSLIVDDSGTVYVADYGNHVIRMVKNGIVSTYAGTGAGGFADGPLSQAQFWRPRDLTFDNFGNIYVSDILNNRIRRIANGQVTTLAGSGIAGTSDGTGVAASFWSPVGIIFNNGFLYVVDGMGNKVRKISMSGVVTTIAGTGSAGYINGACATAQFDLPQGIAIDNAGNLYVGDRNNNCIRIIGNTNNAVSGRVFKDVNSNCNFNQNDAPLANRLIKAMPGPYYTLTDGNGEYMLPLPAGTYTVSHVLNNAHLYDTVCPVGYTHTVSLTNGTTVNNMDFALNVLVDCAMMSVDVAASALRRCMHNNYYVNYCNNGTDSAANVTINVIVDSTMQISNSSNPVANQNGNIYQFNIGTVQAEQCGTFWLTIFLDCNAEIASTHCVKATINPAGNCVAPIDSTWDKSSVSVAGECDDSLACFTITNTGSASNGNMLAPSAYRILENGILVYTGTFQLAGQADTVICWPGNGNTIQLQADQRPGHPGNSHPNDFVEDCGTANGATAVFGFANTIAPDDAADSLEIECLPVIASWDPNDKTVIPSGFGPQNYIYDYEELEYRIRFQNTGNDTAFNIVVIDTLTSLLDVSTVASGASSHPYTFSIEGNGILKWTFANILLPDSTTNEPGSHGFVKFKVKQIPGNAPGTLIENTVGIYFDFNPPVITNTASVKIWEQMFLSTPSSSVTENNIKVFPVPSSGLINFTTSNSSNRIKIYDAYGRLVFDKQINQSEITIDLSKYAKGIYHYQIESGAKLNSGKVILH